MKKPVSSEEIRIRFIELSENGQLMMGDEMIILEHLVNKLNLISLTEYAKMNNISKPAAIKRIQKEPTVRVHKLNYFVK
jgi:hypothetical protein